MAGGGETGARVEVASGAVAEPASTSGHLRESGVEATGVVIACQCNEQIWVRCDRGYTVVSFRASWPLSGQLDLGQRAVVALDAAGPLLSAPRVEESNRTGREREA